MLVAVKFEGCYRWYDSEPDYWVLDQRAWGEAFELAGYETDMSDYTDRFGIAVVDASTAECFLSNMSIFAVNRESLGDLFYIAAEEASDWWSIMDYVPALLVDFDSRELWSIYSENMSFEHYVPAGWTGTFGDDSFFDRIPVEERYWVKDGTDLLAPFVGLTAPPA